MTAAALQVVCAGHLLIGKRSAWWVVLDPGDACEAKRVLAGAESTFRCDGLLRVGLAHLAGAHRAVVFYPILGIAGLGLDFRPQVRLVMRLGQRVGVGGKHFE